MFILFGGDNLIFKSIFYWVCGESKKIISRKVPNNQYSQYNITSLLGGLFLYIIIFNLRGLNVILNQVFLGKLSISLIFLALTFWLSRYIPFFFQKKETFRLFLVGDMRIPALSLLLSNIEILTQFFRPITLMARLWVNIWVGHLILRALSTLSLVGGAGRALRLVFFFFFETGIICLQAFVFSYLIGVYWEENLIHSSF